MHMNKQLYGVMLLALFCVSANSQSLLENLLSNPNRPVSEYTRASTCWMSKKTAEGVAALNDEWITNLSKFCLLPNRPEFPPLMDMAEKYLGKDADAKSQLAALRIAVKRLDDLAAKPGNETLANNYDQTMLHKAFVADILSGLAIPANEGSLQIARKSAPILNNAIGIEAVNVYKVWERFQLMEREKMTTIPGATEAVIILSSATVEAANWNLEKAARRAAMNDPRLQMAGVQFIAAALADAHSKESIDAEVVKQRMDNDAARARMKADREEQEATTAAQRNSWNTNSN